MALHITESNARKAIILCRRVLDRAQSSWLIWSVGDEGYQMAPSSSHEAANIRKYWSETVAGDFSQYTTYREMLPNLYEAMARMVLCSDTRTAKRRAYEARYQALRRAKAAA